MANIEHYILDGIPCSGKGEHSKIIAANTGDDLQIIEMGANFRNEIYTGTDIGKTIADDVWAGNLLDDKYAAQILDRYELARNTVFDGYPRTIGQAKYYMARINILQKNQGYSINPMLLSLKTSEETAVQRMGLRIAGAIRNNRPIRADDVEEILKWRIRQAKTLTAAALEYLVSGGVMVIELNGETDILAPSAAGKEHYARRVSDITNFILTARKESKFIKR